MWIHPEPFRPEDVDDEVELPVDAGNAWVCLLWSRSDSRWSWVALLELVKRGGWISLAFGVIAGDL